MGLCKCPKKKVTNIFCFEHRVNVCEHCLVSNHAKCIVKSYLQWLQDSDYSPACTLCTKVLTADNEQCVRLTCYDVFHWHCLNRYANQMPPNTAPAGYACPTCNAGIFPAQNVASPVAVELRQMLSQVNWARAGLGLPLIDEPEPPPSPAPPMEVPIEIQQQTLQQTIPMAQSTPLKNEFVPASSPAPIRTTPGPSNHTRPSAHVTLTPQMQHSVISVDTGTTVRGQEKAYGVADPRKLFDSTKEDTSNMLNMSHDHDEDKYKRRPALEWLGKWLKSRDGKHKKDPNAVMKRFLFVLIIGLIGFVTVVVIFSKLGRNATDNDPFLDPMANPNIRVNELPKNID
ncbi:zinc finger protein-like 1 homolog [Mizuhopecten yessoensis]|uniref:Zinc finger protein-like 1 n=1 Tax=Mizuhopecten yessoensis TaxID=6573 RepID=A0A210PQA4_MIZYE|nr:zinc finger protein-like 1 homolog [Mizuhopecten yessoensis]OWF38680.1 Zinc finger protein-like 1 [Mizuhopecten yessoensis]